MTRLVYPPSCAMRMTAPGRSPTFDHHSRASLHCVSNEPEAANRLGASIHVGTARQIGAAPAAGDGCRTPGKTQRIGQRHGIDGGDGRR